MNTIAKTILNSKNIVCLVGTSLLLSLSPLTVWSQSTNTTTPATAASSTKTVKADAAAPEELSAFGGGSAAWRTQGTGPLRFFGFKAYDAILWTTTGAGMTSNPLQSKSLFALEIVYNTSLSSEEIVNVSLLEMTRLKGLSDAQRKIWATAMNKFFPAVKKGDRLTGVYVPKVGTRFFFNGKLISEVNDVAFGDAFFAIWLDERAKKPELRSALLGQPLPSNAPVGERL
jgi:hypothetical protein